ncbi:MAG: LytR C-terminal domain-containing protein [Candidatus Berkelbacteria bacterium]|nr:LytR C-terminal domain-containing protein [Candidatus Berkelbacteria bacterium]
MKQFDIEKFEKPRPEVSSEPEKKHKKRGHLLPYLLGLILGIAIVFGVLQVQKNRIKKEEPQKVASTEEVTSETDSTTQTQPEQTVPEATTQAQTQSTATPTVDKSKIAIQVLNGNGVRGDAYRVRTVLQKDGWKVATYGNAASFKYQNTLVYYKADQEEVGKAVGETLKNAGFQTGLQVSETLKKYDILVIIGKK